STVCPARSCAVSLHDALPILAVWPLRIRGRWAHLWPGVWLAVVIELGHAVIVERTFDVTNALVACAGLGIGWIVVRRTPPARSRSEEHTSELQSRGHVVCRLL